LLDQHGEAISDLSAQGIALAEMEQPPLVVSEPEAWHGQHYSNLDFDGELFHNKLGDWDTFVAEIDKIRIGDPLFRSQLDRYEIPLLQATFSMEEGEGMEPLPSQAAVEADDDDGDFTIADRTEIALRVVRANILGKGPREYRMRKQGGWSRLVHEMMTAVPFGFSLLERTWRNQEGRLGTWKVVDQMNWIHPRSISGWDIARDGTFLGIRQTVSSAEHVETSGGRVQRESVTEKPIDATRLVLHVHAGEGANPTGNGLGRAVFSAIRRAQAYRKWRAVRAQMDSAPIPVVTLTEEASRENAAVAWRYARRMRGGGEDLRAASQPPGVTLGFMDMQSNASDTSGPLRAETADVHRGFGSEFALLGSEGASGSLAAGEVMERSFNQRLQALADGVAEALQIGCVEPMVSDDWDEIAMPQLVASDVTPEDVTPVVDALAKLPAMADGDALQAVRDRMDLPAWDQETVDAINLRVRGAAVVPETKEEDPKAKGEVEPETSPKPDEEKEPEETPAEMAERAVRAALGTAPSENAHTLTDNPEAAPDGADVLLDPSPILRVTWRPKTEHERIHMRLGDVDARFDEFHRRFLDSARALHRDSVFEAAGKLKLKTDGSAIVAGKLKRKPWVKLLTDKAEAMREFGFEQAATEIGRQVAALQGDAALAEGLPGRAGEAIDILDDILVGRVKVAKKVAAELQTTIELDIDQLLEAITNDVRAGFLDGFRDTLGDSAADIAKAQEAAAEFALTLPDGGVRRNPMFTKIGRDIASRSFNGGRAEATAEARETLEDTPLQLETVERNAIFDNTCAPCIALDGETFVVDSAEYWANMPPAQCLGGSFCQCHYRLIVTERDS